MNNAERYPHRERSSLINLNRQNYQAQTISIKKIQLNKKQSQNKLFLEKIFSQEQIKVTSRQRNDAPKLRRVNNLRQSSDYQKLNKGIRQNKKMRNQAIQSKTDPAHNIFPILMTELADRKIFSDISKLYTNQNTQEQIYDLQQQQKLFQKLINLPKKRVTRQMFNMLLSFKHGGQKIDSKVLKQIKTKISDGHEQKHNKNCSQCSQSFTEQKQQCKLYKMEKNLQTSFDKEFEYLINLFDTFEKHKITIYGLKKKQYCTKIKLAFKIMINTIEKIFNINLNKILSEEDHQGLQKKILDFEIQNIIQQKLQQIRDLLFPKNVWRSQQIDLIELQEQMDKENRQQKSAKTIMNFKQSIHRISENQSLHATQRYIKMVLLRTMINNLTQAQQLQLDQFFKVKNTQLIRNHRITQTIFYIKMFTQQNIPKSYNKKSKKLQLSIDTLFQISLILQKRYIEPLKLIYTIQKSPVLQRRLATQFLEYFFNSGQQIKTYRKTQSDKNLENQPNNIFIQDQSKKKQFIELTKQTLIMKYLNLEKIQYSESNGINQSNDDRVKLIEIEQTLQIKKQEDKYWINKEQNSNVDSILQLVKKQTSMRIDFLGNSNIHTLRQLFFFDKKLSSGTDMQNIFQTR